ncbi:MAG: porphobilinogen synthase [Alphaproteobacteria bacterium]|nr:porphobilinogen synthase [Alphaproteobacteria bacterium]
MHSGRYPDTRLRRNRSTSSVRALVAEHHVKPADLLQPVFVIPEHDATTTIPNLSGITRMGINPLIDYVGTLQDLGIPGIFLFGNIPSCQRNAEGSEALNPEGIIPEAARVLRAHYPEMMLIADVALDCYTDHGHDGLILDGKIANDATIEVLCQQAQVLAEAGCDSVSPSDMMDGRIGCIRQHLDQRGLCDVRVISYACKYASVFYGPFRNAVGSNSSLLKGNKRTYQLSPTNSDEAMHEAGQDLDEGADMLIIKPGLAYLDILHRVKETFRKPTLSYQVSGEYAMLRHAAEAGILDWDQAILETLTCFKRAGADAIITYAAKEVAEQLQRT